MKRIVFSAVAPVHFVCFRPIYARLTRCPDVEVWFSGGIPREGPDGQELHDGPALYQHFEDVPPERVLPVDEMRRRPFDMAVCAHGSGIFPDQRCLRLQIFHGVSFRNMAIRPKQRAYDYYFLVGPYMRRGFVRRGLLRSAASPRGVMVGFPKVDRLANGALDRARMIQALGLKGDRPVLLYAPTGAKDNSLETMGEEVIRRIRAERAWDLLVKPHDHPKRDIDWFARLRRYEGPHVRVVRGFDVVPFLHVADLLISDASSVATEYTLLDRPIVFLDVPRVLATARRKGGMLDLDTYGRRIGVTVRNPEDVVPAIRESLAHPARRGKIRRAMALDVFHDPGRATDRAVRWILDKLGIGKRAAA